jgi:hypothetical protein
VKQSVADSLGEWTAFYALMGGAAATLLGLLFVAVSLRLNIFRQANVADIRRFAGVTLGVFLTALGIAALALMPHHSVTTLGAPLLVAGLLGIGSALLLTRIWVRLNFAPGGRHVDRSRAFYFWRGLLQVLVMVFPFVGLVGVAVLLGRAPEAALGLLAILEMALLALGTYCSWLLLSHAGSGDPGTS